MFSALTTRRPSLRSILVVLVILAVVITFFSLTYTNRKKKSDDEKNIIQLEPVIKPPTENPVEEKKPIEDETKPKQIEEVKKPIEEEKKKDVDINEVEVFSVPSGVQTYPEGPIYEQHRNKMLAQCDATMGVRRRLEQECPKIPYDYVNFDGRNHKIEEYWPNFSPSREEFATRKEVDFREYFKSDEYKAFLDCSKSCTEEDFDKKKLELNKRFPVLNADKFPKVFEKKFVPLVAMAYKRREPFATVIEQMSKAIDIHETILIITVDGNGFEEVIDVILNIKFMRVYVFFHPFTIDYKNLGITVKSGDCFRNNINYLYGARLALDVFNQGYFALVADDVKPFPDFYVYLKQLAPYVIKNHETILGVSAYGSGPGTDCNYIVTRLTNTGICNQYTLNNVLLEEWHTGYFAGVTLPRLIELIEFSRKDNYKDCFDLWLVCLNTIKKLKDIVPCRHRAVYLPNVGIHGEGHARWDQPLTIDTQTNWNYSNYYVVNPATNKREKVIPIEK